MFQITRGKGFHITFENGWTVSVQFGPGNYCDNYGGNFDLTRELGEKGSSTAECAAWPESGDLVQMPDFMESSDTVSNRSTPAKVLQLMQWAASQPKA